MPFFNLNKVTQESNFWKLAQTTKEMDDRSLPEPNNPDVVPMDAEIPEPDEPVESEEVVDPDQPNYKSYHDMNPDELYQMYVDSFEKQGKTDYFSKDQFLSRARNWIFFTGENEQGYVSVRPQRSGLYKLTGCAGNPKEIYRGFKKLMNEQLPTWGAVEEGIHSMLQKGDFGMITPPAIMVKMLASQIPQEVFGNATFEGVDKDGGLILDYPGMGRMKKYFIANKHYYLKGLEMDVFKGVVGHMVKKFISKFV